ncbi:MAG: divergent PAP2 family protein [Cellulosilyticaceae bacterium]
MNGFQQILENNILMVSLLSWFLAQFIKVILTLVNDRKLDLHKFISSGGMPSSHSSFTTAVAVGVGQSYGYNSPLFAVAAVFCFVVMYDATNVRLEAGKQAALLNRIIDVMQDPSVTLERRLKELLGHTPIQVAAGAILGIATALVFIPMA